MAVAEPPAKRQKRSYSVQDFKSWIHENGGSLYGVDIHERILPDGSGLDRSMRASADLESGSVIAFLPSSLVYSMPKILETPLGQFLTKTFDASPDRFASTQCRTHLLLYTSLVYEKFENEDSLFAPYLWWLPEPRSGGIQTPFWWSEEEIEQELGGTNVYFYVRDKSLQLRKEYELAQEILSGTSFFEKNGSLTYDNFLWAHTVFTSRAFPLKAMSPDYKKEQENQDGVVVVDPRKENCLLCLWPLLDLLNHRRGAKITWLTSSSTTASSSILSSADAPIVPVQKSNDDTNKKSVPGVSFIINESYKAGEEVFNNYGPKSNAEWLLGYGFTIPNNPDDVVIIKVNLGADPNQAWKRRFFQEKLNTFVDEDGGIEWILRRGNDVTSVFSATVSKPLKRAQGLLTVMNVLCMNGGEIMELEQYLENVDKSSSDEEDFTWLEEGLSKCISARTILQGQILLHQMLDTKHNALHTRLFELDQEYPVGSDKCNSHRTLGRHYLRGQVDILENARSVLETYLRALQKEREVLAVTVSDLLEDEGFQENVLLPMNEIITSNGVEEMELEEEDLILLYLMWLSQVKNQEVGGAVKRKVCAAMDSVSTVEGPDEEEVQEMFDAKFKPWVSLLPREHSLLAAFTPDNLSRAMCVLGECEMTFPSSQVYRIFATGNGSDAVNRNGENDGDHDNGPVWGLCFL